MQYWNSQTKPMTQNLLTKASQTISGVDHEKWHRIHRTGGISAMVIAVLLVAETVVYAVIQDPGSPRETLEFFYNKPLLGLLNFDLLGLIAYLFFIPLTLSIYGVLRKINNPLLPAGIVLFFFWHLHFLRQ
jgi:hypothetical protein